MHCKSLWIKASAKCINVNVNVNTQDEFSEHRDKKSTQCVKNTGVFLMLWAHICAGGPGHLV